MSGSLITLSILKNDRKKVRLLSITFVLIYVLHSPTQNFGCASKKIIQKKIFLRKIGMNFSKNKHSSAKSKIYDKLF